MSPKPMFKFAIVPRMAGPLLLGFGLILSWRGAAQDALHLVALESLDLSKVNLVWLKPVAGKSLGNHILTIKGQIFERGVGAHATIQLAIDLNGQVMLFRTMKSLMSIKSHVERSRS